jgi:hypothetical protein
MRKVAFRTQLSSWLVVAATLFSPIVLAGEPATIGPDGQTFQEFDVHPHDPASAWRVSFHVENDDCTTPALGCFYFQRQPDDSWSLYSPVAMDVSDQHPDHACHLGTPADAGSYRIFALNTTKTCALRVSFRQTH